MQVSKNSSMRKDPVVSIVQQPSDSGINQSDFSKIKEIGHFNDEGGNNSGKLFELPISNISIKKPSNKSERTSPHLRKRVTPPF